jgi:Zn ribbon nucleic-acid-binding protein
MIKQIVTRDEFYANHTLCPKCKTGDKMKASNIYIMTSEARDFKDNLNTAWCENCGWRGKRNELLKEN